MGEILFKKSALQDKRNLQTFAEDKMLRGRTKLKLLVRFVKLQNKQVGVWIYKIQNPESAYKNKQGFLLTQAKIF